MDILDTNKLVLFILFVVPGFVSLKTYQLLFPGVVRETSQQLIDAVAYSSINYALLLWPIYMIETHDYRSTNPSVYAGFYVFVLLVMPIAWVCMLRKLRHSEFFQKSMPHPMVKPWDFVFSQRRSYWLVVSLKDGSKIAGRFSDRSFASSAPAAEQIYLEEAWVVSAGGGLERPRKDSAGILILSPDIVSVEFFNLTYGDPDGRRKAEIGPRAGVPEGMAAEPEQPPAQ